MLKFLDVTFLILYCLFIYWLSDQVSLKPPVDFGFDYQDKLYHAAAYFVMGFLAWHGFKHSVSSPVMLGLFSIIFCSLYGLSDEWHQSFIVGRESDSADWAADTLGSILAIGLLYQRYAVELRKRP